MPDNEQVLEYARKLAAALGAHPRFLALRDAENAVRADGDARKLSDELNEQMGKLADLEAKMQPIEPEDKVKLQELREQVHANKLLQNLARAQADYLELMNQVNSLIHEGLASDETKSEGE